MAEIVVCDISKKFGQQVVLDHISMKLSSPHIYGLVGRNGSGKTMLMRHLCGFVRPDSGKILIDGKVLNKEIEKDLRDQLEANGTFGKFFDDMISDYMAMYVTKTLLVEDIQKRGTIVPYNNGGGQSGYKKNEAVDMFNKTNAQMLKLLSELGLKANAAIGGGDYGDEL